MTQQGKYVQVNGLKMYYEEYGSGQPLILLHGGNCHLSYVAATSTVFCSAFQGYCAR